MKHKKLKTLNLFTIVAGVARAQVTVRIPLHALSGCSIPV